MYGNMNERRSFAPVKEGEEIDVVIEAVGEKGDGIAKKEGFVIFVPNTNQGDNVHVRITKVLRKVGFGEVIGQAQSGERASDSSESSDAGESQEEPSEETSDAGESQEEPSEETSDAGESQEDQPQDTEDFGEEEKQA